MSETDRRLKDHLNTNQVNRERMCLEILSVEKDYSDIRPRLPKGGPDGGRDIQGQYKDDLCYGAVGFVNDASNTDEHRKKIKIKFNDDLKNALRSSEDEAPLPTSFVFLTNVSLTPGIISELENLAYKKGINNCDIYDRERIRIVLDSSRGYAIRFRYLDIPLSDAEQKDFFNSWADEINNVIGSGLSGIDQTAKRVQFLLEAQLLLNDLSTYVVLDTPIWDVCKGEFCFQTYLSLRVHSDGLLGIVFGGGSDVVDETPDEWVKRGKHLTSNSQYSFGFSSLIPETRQYENFSRDGDKVEYPKNENVDDGPHYIRTSTSHGVLEVNKNVLRFSTLSEPFLYRSQPTCSLIELHRCMLLFECNEEIANHIKEIFIVGGGYELLKISKSDISIRAGNYGRLKLPKEAKQIENSHKWVTLRPSKLSSAFTIDLMSKTPNRYDW